MNFYFEIWRVYCNCKFSSGHNLGSEHDPETDDCAPSEYDDGKFIMYPWAVSGYDKNNLVRFVEHRASDKSGF